MTLKERFENEMVPGLAEELGISNPLAVPRPVKVVVNVGIGEAKDDEKLLVEAQEELARLSGQWPNVRRARRSESGWLIRAGDPIGVAVTLRRGRMWGFLEKLFHAVLPRVRDFRGLPLAAFDGNGNYTLGIEDHIVFPEIDSDKVSRSKGLEVTIVTNTRDDEKAQLVLKTLGMPFRGER